MYLPPVQHNGLNIKKLLLIPTRRSYQNVYQRSFSLYANTATIGKLEAIFNNTGVSQNRTVSEHILAQTVPDIMQLSAMPIGIANIPNGWGTQRLRFLMEVEANVNGLITVSYIQGFSEYHDPSITGRIDPTMFFYINSITNVVKMMDPVSGRMRVTPRNTMNIITDLAGGSKYEEVENFNNLKLIRPVDIMDQYADLSAYEEGLGSVINTTGTVGAMAETSSRSNNDPIKYVAKTINSFIESKSMSGMTSDVSSIATNASGLLNETGITSIPLIYALHSITGEHTPSTFTLGLLERIDPAISTKTHVIENNLDIATNLSNNLLDTEHTMALSQPTVETMKATTIAQTMNSIMLDCLLSSMDISISNTDIQPVVIVSDAKSFVEGVDLTIFVNNAVSRIKNVLIPKITDGGQTMLEAHVHADILGDTTVGISVNYYPVEVYRFPTFADSLYAPVIADEITKNHMAQDFANIMDLTYTSGQIF